MPQRTQNAPKVVGVRTEGEIVRTAITPAARIAGKYRAIPLIRFILRFFGWRGFGMLMNMVLSETGPRFFAKCQRLSYRLWDPFRLTQVLNPDR